MAWRPAYIVLIVVSTAVDYTVSRLMMGYGIDDRRRKYLLAISLVANLGLLFMFKYFNFFNDSLRQLFIYFDWRYPIADIDVFLPVGISFYTFQTLSYTIDVYRGKLVAEKHLGIFALYVAFWPQLVAGPIERAGTLLPQLRSWVGFDYERVRAGLLKMGWGFFKKLVVADRLSLYVNAIYNYPQNFDSGPILLATFLFSFQIYCDFSGYSDIAIGAAKVLGYDLMENFERPYASQSITEFWRRWHISLSTWFRDYLYIPLGGSRVVKWRWYVNVAIVFLVSGLWHGARWTFFVWGGLHTVYILGELIGKDFCQRWQINGVGMPAWLVKWLRMGVTFSLVTIAWLFFRANSFDDAMIIVRHLFVNFDNVGVFSRTTPVQLSLSLGLIAFLLGHEAYVESDLRQRSGWFASDFVRWGYYLMLMLGLMWLGVFVNREFIYFRF
ncbi:MAG TPA: MBOAT family O-acyltransferase [Anaerolineae bacterium]|nr:MBOAT family O-acyltransferase [Anaerolineae bacterium]